MTGSEGDYTLTLQADGAGIQQVPDGFELLVDAHVTWTTDLTPPVVTVTPSITSDIRPTLAGTVDDPAAPVEVTVAGQHLTAVNQGDGTWVLSGSTFDTALYDGVYDVSVTATDAAGNVGSDVTTDELTITTDTCIDTFDVTPASVSEGQAVALDLQFVEQYQTSAHTVRIDWGDGTDIEIVTCQAGTTGINRAHTYLDDDPSGTVSDLHTISVSVDDPTTGTDEATMSVTVANVAPTLAGLGVSSVVIDGGTDLDDLAAGITRAVELGMTVTVNPFVHPANRSWRGQMDFGVLSPSFFAAYEELLVEVAQMSQEAGVDRLTLGSELRDMVKNGDYSDYWTSLIACVDGTFDGELGYAANWDNYDNQVVKDVFWANSAIDFIGSTPISSTPWLRSKRRRIRRPIRMRRSSRPWPTTGADCWAMKRGTTTGAVNTLDFWPLASNTASLSSLPNTGSCPTIAQRFGPTSNRAGTSVGHKIPTNKSMATRLYSVQQTEWQMCFQRSNSGTGGCPVRRGATGIPSRRSG